MMEKILVTGCAGYIGSHTCVTLLEAGYDVVGLDNLSNGSAEAIKRIQSITGRQLEFVLGDIRDSDCLEKIFSHHAIDAVIHFAGLKAVGESVSYPLKYYDNNVVGTLRLIEAMANTDVRKLVFSSSATVYSAAGKPRFFESSPLGPSSPYGSSKLICEQILHDFCSSNGSYKIALLRYFNPVGAHNSGQIGEAPTGTPNNLMPYIAQVAVAARSELSVFGGDYPTPDGTGIRDYIHVMDLAEGHLAALAAMEKLPNSPTAINLGSGSGHSVLEVIAVFEEVSGKKIPYQIVGRRLGDIADYFADATLAEKLLGWRTKRSMREICMDAWQWQQNNPRGYDSSN